MIDIAQWRAAIGTFNQAKWSSVNQVLDDEDTAVILHKCPYCSEHPVLEECSSSNKLRSAYSYAMLYTCILLYYLEVVTLCTVLTLHIDGPLAVLVVLYGSPLQLSLTSKDNQLLIVVFTFLRLLLSGDVETNPGPIVYRPCPICKNMVPIRSKSCSSCGFKFNQNIKGITKTWSSNMSGLSVANNMTQPTSATSSSNHSCPVRYHLDH